MDKEQIIMNRKKLKLDIKSHKSGTHSQLILSAKKQVEQEEPSGVRRRRKTSQNIKSFDSLSVFKDKSVSQTFDDLFTLGEKLGEGAHSVVYKCTQDSTGNQYAVKVCKRKDPELIESMRETYLVLRQLKHESIASGQYLYLDEKKMTCRLVTELVEYPDLRAHMNEHRQWGPFDEQEVANILNPLLEVAAHMSQKGVCHRDLKPENILYNPSTGKLKLIDFQLAKVQRYTHEKLELWSSTGTLHYRAPETFKGAYGIPIDTWAIGVIAFELLTGELPFKSGYYKKTVQRICTSEIDYEKYNLSNLARNFLKKLLDKSADSRITPKEALSNPFLLKNVSILSPQKLNSSFDQENSSMDSEQEDPVREVKFYDEDATFRLLSSLNRDTGVRFCDGI